MNKVFILHKDNEGLNSNVRLNAVSEINNLPKDKSWKIEISPYRKSRSNSQNNALWGVAYPALALHIGLSGAEEIQELHNHICRMYFGEETKRLFGKSYQRPIRTTTKDIDGDHGVLSSMEFSDFYAFVQRQGAQIGCYVPDPIPDGFR